MSYVSDPRVVCGRCRRLRSECRCPRGAGDMVARMTKAVGIQPCAPCEKRRQKLNRLLPFRRR